MPAVITKLTRKIVEDDIRAIIRQTRYFGCGFEVEGTTELNLFSFRPCLGIGKGDKVMPSLRRCSLAFLLLVFSAAFASASKPNRATPRPNIIVILTDDHGWADLGTQGVRQDIRTPHIDALAAAGARLTAGYVTAPQCVPSRAGLLTGRYQNRFGLESNAEYQQPGGLDGFNAATTIAERLQQAGYATGMAGKWHLGPPDEISRHGFDRFLHKHNNAAGIWNGSLDQPTQPAAKQPAGGYHIDVASDYCCSFIEHHRDQPFFFYLAYRAPHTPLDAPARYTERFPGEMPERRRQALAMLSAVDNGVGRIQATLRQVGIEENTLIFFLGDNGAPLKIVMADSPLDRDPGGWDGSINAPFNGEKGMLAEGGIRVPWLVSWKGRITAGTVRDEPVIALDIAATAAAAAGLDAEPTGLDGMDLVPWLTGTAAPPERTLFWRWIAQAAIREGRWKLLRGGRREYLFDLEADPSEQQNRLAAHPDIAADLRQKLADWTATLQPPGLAIKPMAPTWERYFDHYLDHRPLAAGAPPAGQHTRSRAAAWTADAKAILADAAAAHAAAIDTVHVGAKQVTLTGRCPEPAAVIAIPPERASHRADRSVVVARLTPDEQEHFRIDLPRTAADGRDLAIFRFRLVSRDGSWLSAPRWPTAFGPAIGRKLPPATAPHRKGLGGIPALNGPDHEIFDLGIRHATLNVVLTGLIHDQVRPGWQAFEHAGRTWFINQKLLDRYDETLRQLVANDVIVSAILLIGNQRDETGRPQSPLVHPDAEASGIYAMPNLTAETPARCYAALLELLADRWTREDGAYGRVTNWIMHNEVDQAATWTNMGPQPLPRYAESYHRSVRIMHHTARLFDRHARAFISLTHHWTKAPQKPGVYQVRRLLDRFSGFARAEGDFEWGVAYHPYPQNLRIPDTWADTLPTDDFDTPLITLKNIAVLPRYLDQPRLQFRGNPRAILLSEQGFNTPTLSEADQQRQVAGLLYAFDQIESLPTIEAFHLHRYRDMPEAEGGLRLGIVDETGKHKLGWDAYQAIGGPKEQAFRPIANALIPQP